MAGSIPPSPVPAPPRGREPACSLPCCPRPRRCRPVRPLLCSVPPHQAGPISPSAGRRWARPAPRHRGREAAVRTPGKSFRNRAAPHHSCYCRGSAGRRPPPSGRSPEQPQHKGCAPCPPDSGGAAPRTPSLSPIPQTRGQSGKQ